MKNPSAYILYEGGVWQLWGDEPKAVHAIMFSDGEIFDTVNGWRKLSPLQKRISRAMLGELFARA